MLDAEANGAADPKGGAQKRAVKENGPGEALHATALMQIHRMTPPPKGRVSSKLTRVITTLLSIDGNTYDTTTVYFKSSAPNPGKSVAVAESTTLPEDSNTEVYATSPSFLE